MKIKIDIPYRRDLENRVALTIANNMLVANQKEFQYFNREHLMLTRLVKLALEHSSKFAAQYEHVYLAEQHNSWIRMSKKDSKIYQHWHMTPTNIGKRDK